MEETRYQRLAREQAERQNAREERMQQQRRKKPRRKAAGESNRTADRIDGYDRDDLGESADY